MGPVSSVIKPSYSHLRNPIIRARNRLAKGRPSRHDPNPSLRPHLVILHIHTIIVRRACSHLRGGIDNSHFEDLGACHFCLAVCVFDWLAGRSCSFCCLLAILVLVDGGKGGRWGMRKGVFYFGGTRVCSHRSATTPLVILSIAHNFSSTSVTGVAYPWRIAER